MEKRTSKNHYLVMLKQIIKDTLQKFDGNRSETARVLGIDKTTLWRKMKKFGLL